ncbi:MAG: hypothetical protein ABF747_05890 [Bifidobacterium sp.]|uniref:Uncharacterized protein n=1 Tax=Bifidobacterium fermentum TaxID=3059035 RepID=A0AB39UC07_9BIFI
MKRFRAVWNGLEQGDSGVAVARVAGHLGAVALAPVGHGLVSGLHRIAGEPVFPSIDDLRGTVDGRVCRRENLSPGGTS